MADSPAPRGVSGATTYRNRAETERALRRSYPDDVRAVGIEAGVVLWICVDRTGSVTRVRVAAPSGYASVDSAAAAVARRMEFVPAVSRDRHVGVWVRQAVRFRVR